MSARPAGRTLCRLEEIDDPGSRGFEFDDRSIFVVRRGATVAAYVNSCPHTRGPLDWVEHRFLNLARTHILCGTHGAVFRLEDGYCIDGPCIGDHLTALKVVVESGLLRLLD